MMIKSNCHVRKKNILLSLFLFIQLSVFSEENDTTVLKIIFAGDIMGHDGQIESAYDPVNKTYNYETTFRYVKPYIEQADIALANLEVTLGGPPYKGYPQFSSPDNIAIEAKKAGFDILITANNHSLDRGINGFKRTLSILDAEKIIHTGTFTNAQTRNSEYPLIIEKNNIILALLNYTYGTNGLTIPLPYIVNRIDKFQIKKDIDKARLANPDFIIVTIHWGIEYERKENKIQQDLAVYMLKSGADAIIGSHPHVIQPINMYCSDKTDSSKCNLIVYSLGNFISNMRERYKDGGIFVEMTLQKTESKTMMKDYNYMPVWVYRDDETVKREFYIIPVKLYLNNEEFFKFAEYNKYKIEQFYKDTKYIISSENENTFFDKFELKKE